MRYILDDDGYVIYASVDEFICCGPKECTEYKGEIPNGYESIEEWLINANIRAYKVVDDNLVFDSAKDAELRFKWELEASINTPATVGYVNEKFNQVTSIYDDTLSKTTEALKIDDAGNYEIPSIIIKSKENTSFPNGIKLQVSNKNILVNTGYDQEISGVRFKVNKDKTIDITGTATSDIEYEISGTINNIVPIFMLDGINNLTGEEITFYTSINPISEEYELSNDISLKMYGFNGEDHELVSNSKEVTLSEVKYITCATLFIPSGTKIDGTFVLSIKKQDETIDNTVGQSSKIIDITVSKLESDQFIKIDGEYIKLVKEDDEEIIQSIPPLTSYENYTLIQCSEDVSIETTYRTPIKLAGFDITSDGFTTEIFSNYDYTQEDVDKVNNYLVDLGTLTDEEMIKYDLSGDGKIMSNDALMMRYLIDNGITTTKSLKFVINNKEQVNKYNFLSIINGNGETLTNIGSRGISTNGLTVDGIDILDRFANVGINTKTKVGVNDSGFLYFRGEIEDGTQFQLECNPDGRFCFLKNVNGTWTKVATTGYRVGDMLVNKSDTNPATTYGGTWVCDEIHFDYGGLNNPHTLVNATSATSTAFRSGNFIFVRYQFVPSVDLADSTVNVLNFNLSTLGCTQFYDVVNHCAFTDGGNCVAMMSVAKDGKMSCLDVIPDSKITAGQTVFGSFTVAVHPSHITARGPRFWQRTK